MPLSHRSLGSACVVGPFTLAFVSMIGNGPGVAGLLAWSQSQLPLDGIVVGTRNKPLLLFSKHSHLRKCDIEFYYEEQNFDASFPYNLRSAHNIQ